MKFLEIEKLLFGVEGACVLEDEKLCNQALDKVYELLDKVDGKSFDVNDYKDFVNIYIRFTAVVWPLFNIEKKYSEVLSKMYEILINSDYYTENEV